MKKKKAGKSIHLAIANFSYTKYTSKSGRRVAIRKWWYSFASMAKSARKRVHPFGRC